MNASLRVDTALYGVAVVIDRLLALLLLPLLTRAIGAADYGVWAQTLVGAGLLLPLVLFALPTAIVRSFSDAAAAPWRRPFFRRLGMVVVAIVLAVAALSGLAGGAVAELVWGDGARAALVPALLGVLAADAGYEFATAWLRAAGRIGVIATLLLARSVLRYLVLWLLAGGAMPIDAWLGSYALAQDALALGALGLGWMLAGAGAPDAARAARAGAAANAPKARELLAFCLPLVALAMFTALNASFDRLLLVRLLGLDAVAVYAAASSVCSIPGVFYSVLGFVLFPVLARHWAEGRHDEAARLTDRALQVYAFLNLPLALALALSGPWLLPWLTTAAFRAPLAVFALLGASVTAFGLYQILLYALLLAGRSRQVLALAVGAAAANLAFNLVLAPRLGAVGAAAAAAVSNTLMVIVATRLAGQIMAWRFPAARLASIAGRAVLAAAPLAGWVAVAKPGASLSWGGTLAVLALGAALYIGLDLAHRNSVLRGLRAW